jgi:Domain of unknown function (DUF4331)
MPSRHICSIISNNKFKTKKMKKSKRILSAAVVVAAVAGGILYAADHIDSPAVTNQTTDITDVYAFRGQNTNNIVLVGNTQGLLSPSATGTAKFDENTLIEFNIDNNNDNVEDLVIQAIAKNGKMKVYGPYKPATTGTRSEIDENQFTVQTDITNYGETAKVSTQKGVTLFAGPRDDPFFFDLDQFRKVVGGTATSFNSPGNDSFKGTNVLSTVIEIPKTMLGSGSSINVWLETKKAIN